MSPRLAVRGIVLHQDRLLLVNAWAAHKGSDLMCCPGGGVERGSSLPDNLVREIHEECGLHVSVGAPCLVNEFHDPDRGFHQVEVFFRCSPADPTLDPAWQDPERIVSERRWVTRDEMSQLRFKPSSLPSVAWGDADALNYDALERILT